MADGFPVLAALDAAGKVVSAWILPGDDPDRDLALSGADVTAWAAAYGSDKVTLTQATGGQYPQWDPSLYGGKGGVVFDGTNDRLEATSGISGWPGATDDLWMLVACRRDATSGIRVTLEYGNAGANSRRLGIGSLGPIGALVGSSPVSGGTNIPTGASVTIAVHGDIGGVSYPYLNGVVDSAGTVTTTAGMTPSRVRMGATSAASPTLFMQGVIVAAAILGPTADITDFANLETEFRARLDESGGPVEVAVPAAPVAITGLAPGVAGGKIIAVPSAGLSITALAPKVATGAYISAPGAEVGLSAYPPAVLTGAAVGVPASAIGIAGLSPAVAVGASLSIPTASVSVAAFGPGIATGAGITPPAFGIGVAALAPGVLVITRADLSRVRMVGRITSSVAMDGVISDVVPIAGRLVR